MRLPVCIFLFLSAVFNAASASVDKWSNVSDLGGGWKWVEWLGAYYVGAAPWVYHPEHEWLFVAETEGDSNVWAWDRREGWLWTSKDVYPSIWRNTAQDWIWYDRGSKEPRYFFSFSQNQWLDDGNFVLPLSLDGLLFRYFVDGENDVILEARFSGDLSGQFTIDQSAFVDGLSTTTIITGSFFYAPDSGDRITGTISFHYENIRLEIGVLTLDGSPSEIADFLGLAFSDRVSVSLSLNSPTTGTFSGTTGFTDNSIEPLSGSFIRIN